jgi:hypothetical protein
MNRTTPMALLLFVSLTGLSRADVVPPNVGACRALSFESACKTDQGAAGTCQNSTCYEKDMAHWDRDASAYPPSTPVACLECVASTSTTDDDSKDSSGCSLSGARGIAPWLLAGICAVTVTLVRRRRGR